MMTRDEFDQLTRGMLKRRPFRPFVLERFDGERFIVGQPEQLHSLFGSADYLSADGEIHLLDFENVIRVVELTDAPSQGVDAMTKDQFTDSLRALLRRQPFVPFTVELAHGERFLVDRPDAVALRGGSAGFLSEDGPIYLFDWQNTRQLGPASDVASA